MAQPESHDVLWRCTNCNLFNRNQTRRCQACFTCKSHSQFDVSKGYDHLTDAELAQIIIECDSRELKDIFTALEYKNAIYKNHSFLSLLIDIGRINLIFLLFEKNYKFALNYASNDSSITHHDTVYLERGEILPLSMAFERDELYLIKLLLKKGASPNQCMKLENLRVHYEWFDLSEYQIYLHYLPISIPIHKHIDNLQHDEEHENIEFAEYESVFDLMIEHGALWYQDEYMFMFCNKDASFWIDFLSSHRYHHQRSVLHNAMKKYYRKIIRPLIQKTCLYEVQPIMAEYFCTFPMIDISNEDQHCSPHLQSAAYDIANSSMTTIRLSNQIYAKILQIHRPSERVVGTTYTQYEYTVIDEHDTSMNILVTDERIWKTLKIGDVICINNASLQVKDSYDDGENENDSNHVEEEECLRQYERDSIEEEKTMSSKFQIVHSMTLTPSISVVKDEGIIDKFQIDDGNVP